MEGNLRRISIEELRNNPFEMTNVIMAIASEVPLEMAVAMFRTVIDQLCANNDMTSEQTIELYENICTTAKQAQELFGMPPRTV